MSAVPVVLLNPKYGYAGANNRLYESATQSNERKARAPLDYDTHSNITPEGRRVMMSNGRWVYANVPQVRGACNEKATYTCSHYIAQFDGEDQAWGEEAESWLREHDKICELSGMTMDEVLRNVILSYVRDGDCGIVFTETTGGYPMLQFIASHRIGRRSEPKTVPDGEYKGNRLVDGVILDDYGRRLAYRIYGENSGLGNFVDVPAKDFRLAFVPDFGDQKRGFSQLASGLSDWQDIKEWRGFELQAQKIGASIALIETNEHGEAAPGTDAVTIPGVDAVTAGTPTGLVTESYDGGEKLYMRAGSGGSIESLKFDRPSTNQQAFEDKITRAAFAGMNWSMDFSLDPTKPGGAQMRVVVEKINREIEVIQTLLLEPLRRAIDGWRISKAVKLGQLRPNAEWYKWTYQGPARITADEKYSTDVAIARLRANLTCQQDEVAKLGGDWRTVAKSQPQYFEFLDAEAKKRGVDPDRVVWPSPNGPPPEPAAQDQPPNENQ